MRVVMGSILVMGARCCAAILVLPVCASVSISIGHIIQKRYLSYGQLEVKQAKVAAPS
jgi:hypothetical protein